MKQLIPELYSNLNLNQALKVMMRKTKNSFSKTYYPCSGTDTSVADALKLRNVVHIDKVQLVVDLMKNHNLNAFCCDVVKYRPGRMFDLIVLVNSQLNEEKISKIMSKLKIGGYVLCGDSYLEASSVKKLRNFEIKAIIRKNSQDNVLIKDGVLIWDEMDTDSYWRKFRHELAYDASGNLNPGSDNFFVFEKKFNSN